MPEEQAEGRLRVLIYGGLAFREEGVQTARGFIVAGDADECVPGAPEYQLVGELVMVDVSDLVLPAQEVPGELRDEGGLPQDARHLARGFLEGKPEKLTLADLGIGGKRGLGGAQKERPEQDGCKTHGGYFPMVLRNRPLAVRMSSSLSSSAVSEERAAAILKKRSV